MISAFQYLIQELVLLPTTILYYGGTFGKNLFIRDGTPYSENVTHIYNNILNVNTVMNQKNSFQTGFALKPSQQMDFIRTLNIL